jgi:hypothetical protein
MEQLSIGGAFFSRCENRNFKFGERLLYDYALLSKPAKKLTLLEAIRAVCVADAAAAVEERLLMSGKLPSPSSG